MKNQARRQPYVPLRSISDDPSKFLVIDSSFQKRPCWVLNMVMPPQPRTLTIWEAQFGDFANGAQVVIDQFISSGEAKWQRLCGLTLFAPWDGGSGPRALPARLERFLQLCGDNNMQVCVPDLPAQFFLLRRQMIRPLRRPLVVTPKSLLRHRHSVSSLNDMTQGHFQNLIDDASIQDKAAVTRVVLCTGKVFDLDEGRIARKDSTTAIIRLEQLYPLPQEELETALAGYPNRQTLVWCQESLIIRDPGTGSRITCHAHYAEVNVFNM